MRLTILFIFGFLFLFLRAGAHENYSSLRFPPPDSVPPPPFGEPNQLSGPGEACVGETSVYSTDVPIACVCQWSVNGIIQPETSSTFVITWSQQGLQVVSVTFICSNGTSEPSFVNVLVLDEPLVFLGNDTTILQGQILVLDAGNPGSTYLWSTGETTRTLPVSVSGSYSVIVSNICGMDADTIEVAVFVGISEPVDKSDCFILSLQHNKINLSALPAGTTRVQIINLSGKFLYDGPPVRELKIDQQGIYIVRINTAEISCCKKVFIP